VQWYGIDFKDIIGWHAVKTTDSSTLDWCTFGDAFTAPTSLPAWRAPSPKHDGSVDGIQNQSRGVHLL
jgi:hypothetical protein